MASEDFVSSKGLGDAIGGNFTCLNATAELSGKKGDLDGGCCSAHNLSGLE